MSCCGWQLGLSSMRDRFGIFGAVIRNRKLSLLLVMTLRMPNSYAQVGGALNSGIWLTDYLWWIMMDWLINASGGYGSAYIVWWDEPQPLDQTEIEQGSRCVVEVSWRPSREGESNWQGDRTVSLACGAGRPHLVAFGLPLCSRVF